MFQEARPNTVQEEMRRQDVKTVSPFYKTGGTGALNGDVRPSPSTTLSMSSKLSTPTKLTGSADYKVHQTQDHYKLHVIDPKVQSTANMPVSSQTLPSAFRKKPASGDFPSQHTKRSFLKLAPIEQRRLRSVETRPITTSTYLTESLERHRDMEASRLRDYLKAKEKDANQPWNKPNWPGPREDDTSNSLQELENIRKVSDNPL
uniref:Uncharacterized protein n=1 Tax=Plectus sambesii TaxID=2011161 RepID=A0A914WAG3_9BILA